jgi:hypothetical protein
MKNALIFFMCTIVVAASALVLVDKVWEVRAKPKGPAPESPAPAPVRGGGGDAAIAARLASVEKTLEQVRLMLEIPKQDPSEAESREAGEEGPPAGAGIGERLQWIESELNDLRRQSNRDFMQMFARVRARFDELEAKLVKGVAPDTKATAADLKKLGIDYQPDKQLISMEAAFVQPTRVLEFVGVESGGNAYESLLVLNAKPSALKRAVELMGIAEAPDPPYDKGNVTRDMGVYLYVTWKDRKAPVRIEKLLINASTGKPLAPTPFVFTASRSIQDPRTWDEHFAADVYKNTIALTWNKASESVLACPDREAAQNQVWMPAADVVPEPPMPATLYVSKEIRPEWE